jgi:hypothetical protein
MNARFATKNIEAAYKDITKRLTKLYKKYLSLINVSPNEAISFLMHKYSVHFKRMIKMKKIRRKIKYLTDKMTLKNLEEELEIAEEQREKFLKFIKNETARGLVYPLSFYEEKTIPIIFEDI